MNDDFVAYSFEPYNSFRIFEVFSLLNVHPTQDLSLLTVTLFTVHKRLNSKANIVLTSNFYFILELLLTERNTF